MSTSDPKGAPGTVALPGGATASSWPEAFPGLPDAALVANWANEFFRAASQPAASPITPAAEFGTPPVHEFSPGPLPSANELSWGQLATLPATLSSAWPDVPGVGLAQPTAASAATADKLSPTSMPSAPSAPLRAAVESTGAPSMPGLYFLDTTQAERFGGYEPKQSATGLDPRERPAVFGSSPSQREPLQRDAGSTPPWTSASVQPRATGVPSAYQPTLPGSGARQFDAQTIKRDFPILNERVNGRPLVWLDNAATTQKPQSVIDRIATFYQRENSNVHRGAHTLAARSTDAYEQAREKVRGFLNASSTEEIVFVRGATEGINLIAQSWGRRYIRSGDEIIISWLEHHSNIVPWQLLCAETGARLRIAPVDDRGQILLDEYERLFNPRTRLVSFTHVSNALGTVTPAQEMIAIAHRYGARVAVDGAQAVSHMKVDVQALDCDFYVFSGHKVFGPTGIGAVYGKSDVLSSMPAWHGGGNMIVDVTFERSVYQPPPQLFEAGTGNIADAVGLGAAIDYVERIGLDTIARYEHELLEYGTERLLTIPKLRMIGTAREKAGVLGFVIDGLSTEQIGSALAREGIAVRSGHHCAQPALRRFGLESTVRPSLAFYNTCEDIDALIHVLEQLQSAR